MRTGDFNIKPGDTSYDVITKGKIQDGTSPAEIPKIPHGSKWVAKLKRPLRSAYMTSHGSEPDFTNFAHTSPSEEPFIDCLDYIFISDEWQVPCRSAGPPSLFLLLLLLASASQHLCLFRGCRWLTLPSFPTGTQ